MVMEAISVKYREHNVGAVSYNTKTGIGSFEFEPSFIRTGIELSPIEMPLSRKVYSFPGLVFSSFRGLPGMIADSLPDDFGNAVMNAWIVSIGKLPSEITPIQRLQYIGKRGMGALTYFPATQSKNLNSSQNVEIESLKGVEKNGILDNKNISLNMKSLYNARRFH